MNNKGLSVVGVIIIVAVVTIVAVGYYYLQNMQSREQEVVAPADDLGATNNVADIDISGWKTYRNEELGFEIKYPPEWEYTEENSPWESVRRLPLLIVRFGLLASHRFLKFGCVDTDIESAGGFNYGGTDSGMALIIDGKSIQVKGKELLTGVPGIEGPGEFGFGVWYCGDQPYGAAGFCMQFYGWTTPINEVDKKFIESVKFMKNINSWDDRRCIHG